jgi:transposase
MSVAMMGQKALAGKLFYRVSLEELVPAGHLLRRVTEAVDFRMARRLTARFYSHTGQPSVDPVVLFKMALLGYLNGLPSERRLADEIRVNLAYRWYVGYDLDEAIPDHSVLSKARRRFGPTVYEAFFTDVVRQCERAGLIRGDRLFLDSTLVAAHADLGRVGSPRVDPGVADDGRARRRPLGREPGGQVGSSDRSRPTGRRPGVGLHG